MVEVIPGPTFSFALSCEPLYLLSKPCRFRINLACELESQEPVTILVKDSIFDPAAILNGCISVIDLESGEHLTFHGTEKEGLRTDHQFLLFEPGRSKLFTWKTAGHSKDSSSYFLNLKESNIQPNRRYTVQYQDHKIKKWFYGSEQLGTILTARTEDPEMIVVHMTHHDHNAFNVADEQPKGPPLEASLKTSVPQLDLSGDPPFTVTIDWKLIGSRKICILLNLDCWACFRLLVHEPGSRKQRAPQKDQFFNDYEPGEPIPEEETPEFRYGLSDPALLRIAVGDVSRMSCTFTVEYRQSQLTRPDTVFLVSGRTYIMSMKPHKCRWAYEDELPRGDLDDKRLEELLELIPESSLVTDCSLNLKVIGEHPEQRGRRDYALVDFEFIPAPR